MKRILLIAFIFLFVKVEAQNMVISFSSTKTDEKIDSVLVENLSQGKSVVLKGTTNLELTESAVTSVPGYGLSSQLKVYPNPVSDVCFLRFENNESGSVVVGLYDLTGKQIISQIRFLEQGVHEFQLSGLPSGILMIKIVGMGFNYTDKIISTGKGSKVLNLKYSGKSSNKQNPTQLKNATTNVLMQYNTGERLKYTLYSNGNITVQTDVPTQSKTVTSTFYEAKDGDGNSYATVTIGTQTWMAENLAYLPSVNLPREGSFSNPFYYVYDYSGTNVTEAKATANYKTYGVLYNWPAALSACPTGWHLPSEAEWTTLINYLGEFHPGEKLSEEGKTHWDFGGFNNNSSGFTALPGGCCTASFKYANDYEFIRAAGLWWSSNEYFVEFSEEQRLAGVMEIDNGEYVGPRSRYPRNFGLSVRCVKD